MLLNSLKSKGSYMRINSGRVHSIGRHTLSLVLFEHLKTKSISPKQKMFYVTKMD